MQNRARLGLVALMVAISSSALADDSDLLVPLSAAKPKPRHKPKPKPAPATDDLAPLEPAKPGAVRLELVSTAPGASAVIDGKDVGVLPKTVSLPAGTHSLTVHRLGFKDLTMPFEVRSGAVVSVPIVLEPLMGVVRVHADTRGASVTVDGREMGSAPIADFELAPGAHDIWVSQPGMVADHSRIVVRAGKDYVVRAHLSPLPAAAVPVAALPTASESNVTNVAERKSVEPAWYARWYVIAGAAAIVAGGVATAVVLSQPAPKLDSSIPCRGPCDATLNGLAHF